MPTYIYRARDENGKLVKGAMDAASPDELSAKLRKMGYMTTAVAEAKPGIGLENLIERLRPIRAQDLVIFNFQLANMIESGIPILAALHTIGLQIENKKLKEIIGDVQRNVEGGGYFSASLNNHPAVFSKLFVSMVKAGEESGKLDTVLKRYALFYESQQEFREKIKGALFYPAILLIASALVIVFIVTFIVPQFVGMFSRAGMKLPFITLVLFFIGLAIKKYWHMALLGLVAALFFLGRYHATKRGKLQFDRILLKLPVVGPLARKIYVSRFSHTLATLISSGVPILHSLDISREVVANEVIADVIARMTQAVEHGQKISESLKVSGEFPPDTVQMIAIGEETGKLDEMLTKISNLYDMAIGYAIKKLTAFVEPAFLAIMGVVIAFIMASMLIPIFNMVKILRHY